MKKRMFYFNINVKQGLDVYINSSIPGGIDDKPLDKHLHFFYFIYNFVYVPNFFILVSTEKPSS